MKDIQEFVNRIICGDCIPVMREMPSRSVDLVVADPPFLVNYMQRQGRGYANDDPNDARWLEPAFAEVYRVLKGNTFCVCFFGYYQAEKFLSAWRKAGFRILDQLVWKKNYPSSVGMVQRFHESAYLLGKGRPPKPQTVPPSVLDWKYAGNKMHPAQKPVMVILPLIQAYSKEGDIVLDPFAGCGTGAVAARQLGRRYIGIEISEEYARIAQKRLGLEPREMAS